MNLVCKLVYSSESNYCNTETQTKCEVLGLTILLLKVKQTYNPSQKVSLKRLYLGLNCYERSEAKLFANINPELDLFILYLHQLFLWNVLD